MVDVCRLPVGEENEITVTLDDLAREGARRMIAAALNAEVEQYVTAFVGKAPIRVVGGLKYAQFYVREGRRTQLLSSFPAK